MSIIPRTDAWRQSPTIVTPTTRTVNILHFAYDILGVGSKYYIRASHTGRITPPMPSLAVVNGWLDDLRQHLTEKYTEPAAVDYDNPAPGEVCDCCKDAPGGYHIPGLDGTFCWPCMTEIADRLSEREQEHEQHKQDIRAHAAGF